MRVKSGLKTVDLPVQPDGDESLWFTTVRSQFTDAQVITSLLAQKSSKYSSDTDMHS